MRNILKLLVVAFIKVKAADGDDTIAASDTDQPQVTV